MTRGSAQWPLVYFIMNGAVWGTNERSGKWTERSERQTNGPVKRTDRLRPKNKNRPHLRTTNCFSSQSLIFRLPVIRQPSWTGCFVRRIPEQLRLIRRLGSSGSGSEVPRPTRIHRSSRIWWRQRHLGKKWRNNFKMLRRHQRLTRSEGRGFESGNDKIIFFCKISVKYVYFLNLCCLQDNCVRCKIELYPVFAWERCNMCTIN